MEEPEVLIASYPTRGEANRAADALAIRGLRCRVPRSPEENGEWGVLAQDRIAHTDADRHRRFLRSHIAEPASW